MWDQQAQSQADQQAANIEEAELLIEHERVLKERKAKRKNSIGGATKRNVGIN